MPLADCGVYQIWPKYVVTALDLYILLLLFILLPFFLYIHVYWWARRDKQNDIEARDVALEVCGLDTERKSSSK